MSSTRRPQRLSLAIRSLGADAAVVDAAVAAGDVAVAVVAVAAAAAGDGGVAPSAKSSHRLLNPTVKNPSHPLVAGALLAVSTRNWEN